MIDMILIPSLLFRPYPLIVEVQVIQVSRAQAQALVIQILMLPSPKGKEKLPLLEQIRLK